MYSPPFFRDPPRIYRASTPFKSCAQFSRLFSLFYVRDPFLLPRPGPRFSSNGRKQFFSYLLRPNFLNAVPTLLDSGPSFKRDVFAPNLPKGL